MAKHVATRPVFEGSAEATHWTCPESPDEYTHHMVRYDRGEMCQWCHETRATLVERHNKILEDTPPKTREGWESWQRFEIPARTEDPEAPLVNGLMGIRTLAAVGVFQEFPADTTTEQLRAALVDARVALSKSQSKLRKAKEKARVQENVIRSVLRNARYLADAASNWGYGQTGDNIVQSLERLLPIEKPKEH